MEVGTIVYQKYLSSQGVYKKTWSFVRRLLIKLLNDPICSLSIQDTTLRLPLSHKLPQYLKNFPFYDRLPQRLSEYIHQKYGFLNCIDVGANIGDSIACFYQGEEDIFLGIEPNPKFHKLLKENWDWNKNVSTSTLVCSSSSEDSTFSIKEERGTASISQAEDGLKMSSRPLDDIVQTHQSAMDANLLKIDTDGHDFEVLLGSKALITRQLPIVLFECQPFGNNRYIEECLESLRFFEESGYSHFLLYDNFGYLMGKYSLAALLPFENLLFYQLISKEFHYFDILVMKEEDLLPFYKSEIQYFANSMYDKSLQQTAITTADRIYA